MLAEELSGRHEQEQFASTGVERVDAPHRLYLTSLSRIDMTLSMDRKSYHKNKAGGESLGNSWHETAIRALGAQKVLTHQDVISGVGANSCCCISGIPPQQLK